MASYAEAAQAILQALGPDARAALAGGVAVGAHGYVRATKDVDVVVGFPLDEARRRLEAQGIPTVLHRGDPREGDFSCLKGRVGGVPFDVIPPLATVAWDEVIEVPIGSIVLRVVDLGSLLALKLRAGGPQDILDAAMLVLLHPASEAHARERARVHRLEDRFARYLADPRLQAQAEELRSR